MSVLILKCLHCKRRVTANGYKWHPDGVNSRYTCPGCGHHNDHHELLQTSWDGVINEPSKGTPQMYYALIATNSAGATVEMKIYSDRVKMKDIAEGLASSDHEVRIFRCVELYVEVNTSVTLEIGGDQK